MTTIRKMRWAVRRHSNWLSWLLMLIGLILILISVPTWVWIAIIGLGLIFIGILVRRRKYLV
ncbi:MAG: hypothetical protein BAA01_12940 [Bacillus thermozeamaize]|jgi:membrane-bound ClpP family serine protease|uniref:Uncharacterized protein n=1 Tax=Bacillus thermozeamaize TaxID=230954 RepID=A0A1Y3PKX5_9BACI|nr:MAG: hypothetical protein BAA01_12940 [Bacillus thermozeamaize]